jgi:L-asparaginase/beta-aspartyl-peptidase (threonine type)
VLEAGGSALDAAVVGVCALEDDGRFNAGCGSALRLDGKTVEMDAAVMDSRGAIGIVIGMRDVKNPVRAARAVMETPHVALAGEGGDAFARVKGLQPRGRVSEHAQMKYQKVKELIRSGLVAEYNPLWRGHDVKSLWNFTDIAYEEVFSSDTVGAVAIDRDGSVAAANSTGGASPMMLGRVGDTPMPGCGIYAGASCAVAATGIGEEIIRRMLARAVYDMITAGEDVGSACQKGVEMFPPEIMTGVIAISRTGWAVWSNTDMAHFALVKEA